MTLSEWCLDESSIVPAHPNYPTIRSVVIPAGGRASSLQKGPLQTLWEAGAKPGTWLLKWIRVCVCVYAVGHKPFQCMVCKRSFGSNSMLKAHLSKTHSGSKNFQCTKCSAAFTTNPALQRHVLQHLDGHQCPLCPESFRTVQLVERHIKEQHSQSGNEGIHLLICCWCVWYGVSCPVSVTTAAISTDEWWHISYITEFTFWDDCELQMTSQYGEDLLSMC